MIKIKNLNKYYGDVQILKNVDVEISKGEILELSDIVVLVNQHY